MLLPLLLSLLSADPTPSRSISGSLEISETAMIIICVVVIVGGGITLFFLFRYFCWNRFQRDDRNDPGLVGRVY
jgi:hypothetical protein